MWLLRSGRQDTKRVCILKADSLAKTFPMYDWSQSRLLSFPVFDMFSIVRVSKSGNAELRQAPMQLDKSQFPNNLSKGGRCPRKMTSKVLIVSDTGKHLVFPLEHHSGETLKN